MSAAQTRNIELDRDALVVAQMVALVHARRKRDYLGAADAHRELERLGVLVKFPRPQRKAVANAR